MKTISIAVNAFDDWGKVTGTKSVAITQAHVADIVGHAAQLIAVHRAARRSSGDMEEIIAELDEAMYATSIFDAPQAGSPSPSNKDGWNSAPTCCPYCGSHSIREVAEWESHSTIEENTAKQTEYQCHGTCEGRSFWC